MSKTGFWLRGGVTLNTPSIASIAQVFMYVEVASCEAACCSLRQERLLYCNLDAA